MSLLAGLPDKKIERSKLIIISFVKKALKAQK